VGPGGELAHTFGKLRFVDEAGRVLADQVDPADYADWLGEAVEPWSYLKFPYYRPLGYPGGLYRVGPLARLNACTRAGTPLAEAELEEFRQLGRGAVLSSFHAHYARLVEILSDDVRAEASRNALRGVGSCEAPRGTLFHDYRVARDGTLTRVNLLVATGQNNLAMNRTVAQIARHFLSGRTIEEGLLNRVEAGIRAYDPCLSCSTHAVGRMPLLVELRGPAGELLASAGR
jgi:NAD-reducing hydrogenase large subunit